jgi:hypothetical protein
MKPFNLLVDTVTITDGQDAAHIDLKLSQFISSNELLVLEFISTSSEMPTGQKPNPVIVVTNKIGSAVVQHYLVTQFQLVYAGNDVHKSATPVTIRLLHDLTFRVAFLRDGTNGDARCFVGLSGYITKA